MLQVQAWGPGWLIIIYNPTKPQSPHRHPVCVALLVKQFSRQTAGDADWDSQGGIVQGKLFAQAISFRFSCRLTVWLGRLAARSWDSLNAYGWADWGELCILWVIRENHQTVKLTDRQEGATRARRAHKKYMINLLLMSRQLHHALSLSLSPYKSLVKQFWDKSKLLPLSCFSVLRDKAQLPFDSRNT